jgi:hypothetical protein
MVFCGEVVVGAWFLLVGWMVVLWRWKFFTFLNFIFVEIPDWGTGAQRSN